MTPAAARWAPDDYLSSDRLRRMVLDFIQMHEFMQQPLVFDRGEGIWVWDVRGDRYLDGISGVWVVAPGHGNRRVAEAITRAAREAGVLLAHPVHQHAGGRVRRACWAR